MIRSEQEEHAKPILKWAGGKTKLLPEILMRLPEKIVTYYEPFLGGGAVFFELANRKLFETAIIGDTNAELVNLYSIVRGNVDGLISKLAEHAPHAKDEDYYYSLRAQQHQDMSNVERAARMIYLNKTCYNGLYRENKKGQFNVPCGRYANPRVLDEDALRSASRALQKAYIFDDDFDCVADTAKRGDAVYFDPPYIPVSATSNFTAYGRNIFAQHDHIRLKKHAMHLSRLGVSVLISNSDCDASRKLYEGFKIETVEAPRRINSKASKRGPVKELLVSHIAA